jgi:hypothetical protein
MPAKMIVAELRGIDWYEEGSLENHHPDPERPFWFEVNLTVGEKGHRGADLFVVTVCNVLAIGVDLKRGPVLGFGRFIVERFDFLEFQRAMREYCAQCVGESWKEVALKVSRIGTWEFDYDHNDT